MHKIEDYVEKVEEAPTQQEEPVKAAKKEPAPKKIEKPHQTWLEK